MNKERLHWYRHVLYVGEMIRRVAIGKRIRERPKHRWIPYVQIKKLEIR